MSTQGSSFPGASGSFSQEATEGCASASLISSRKLKVTLLSSEWGSTKGGLSTINRELAIQLAKNDNVEVSMYLPLCSEEDERAAAGFRVCLLKAKKKPGYDPIDWLASVPKDHHMDVVIGHGIHLGRQVLTIKEICPDCKWIQVVHTDPEELAMFKDYAGPTVKGAKKHQAEVELCELADQVVAVGPKLTEAFACYLHSCGKGQDVINLTPGIFSEFANINQAAEERETFRVLVFGRGDSEDFLVKGYDIASRAVAMLKDEERSFKLVFVGAPDGDEDKVKERFLKEGILPSQLIVRSAKERNELAKQFYEADLVMMPSRTEAFGLAALEALSAGVPVLVSGNSGLGKALKKVLIGSYFVVNSENPKKWAKAIRTICSKEKELRLREAIFLRQSYAETYQWEGQCNTLIEKMFEMVKETFTAPAQAVVAVNLGEQGPSSVSESVSHPDATTIQHIVGDAVSSGRENVIQRKRPRTYSSSTTEKRQRLNAGISESDTGTMSSLIGILVDVSDSMRNSAGDRVNEERGNWARSIFKVVDELIKHDVESSNQTFALALGSPKEPEVFDLLGTVRVATEEAHHIKDLSSRKQLTELIDDMMDILEGNGAVRVRTWWQMDVLLKVLDKATAAAMLYYLQRRPDFARRFVFECLPQECREVVVQPLNRLGQVQRHYGRMPFVFYTTEDLMGWASESSVREAIEKGKQLLAEIRSERPDIKMAPVSKAAIMSDQSASEILHNSIGENDEENVEERHIKDISSRKQLRELIDEMMDILERNGAVRIRTWWQMDVLLKVLDKATAAAMLYYLQRRPDFARRFVFECLPQECREVVVQPLNRLGQVQRRYGRMPFVSYTAEDLMGWASESSVREAIEKGKQLLAEIRSERPDIKMAPVSKAAIMSDQSASEILHNSIGENDEENFEERHIKDISSRKQLTELIDEMMDILERNGAVRVRTWWQMDVLLKVLDKATAAAMLYYLQRRPDFARRFVFECLPQECLEVVVQTRKHSGKRGFRGTAFVSYTAQDLMGWASESSVREAMEKGKQLLEEIRSERTIMSVQNASAGLEKFPEVFLVMG
ncbi:uncharacterized protein [Acropora muricata]|uniref:uncharacterized protein isoform X2 n=1 Tax=Acropora muricata TaxID=159855 RepID=UPI0034E56C71